MSDFETHPIGTADEIERMTAALRVAVDDARLGAIRIADLEAVLDAAKVIAEGSCVQSAYWEEELVLLYAIAALEDKP